MSKKNFGLNLNGSSELLTSDKLNKLQLAAALRLLEIYKCDIMRMSGPLATKNSLALAHIFGVLEEFVSIEGEIQCRIESR
jgi:ABC-type uncharacterized transport system YnjBCD ATPase subunit